MAKRGKKGVAFTATDIANIVQSNPYLQTVLNDGKLRRNVSQAVTSGKKAYGRIADGKTPMALLEDKKLHAEMGRALGAARDATITVTRIQGRARRRLSKGRVLVLATAGGAVAVVANEKLRSKVLDLLFGAEEEFQYTPPSNSSPAQSSSTVGAA